METAQTILCGFNAAREKVQATKHGIRSIVSELRNGNGKPVCFAVQIPDYYFWEAEVLLSKISRSDCDESFARMKLIALANDLWSEGDSIPLVEAGMKIFEFFHSDEQEGKTDFALKKLEGKMFSLVSGSLIRGLIAPALRMEGFRVEYVPASSFVPKLLTEVTPHKKGARKLVKKAAKKFREIVIPLITESQEECVAILTECGIGYSEDDIFAFKPIENDPTIRIINRAVALSSKTIV